MEQVFPVLVQSRRYLQWLQNVSVENQIYQGWCRTGSFVGETTWDCCWKDLLYVLWSWRTLPEGSNITWYVLGFFSFHLTCCCRKFNQGAQLIGKPDLAPSAWVKKLVTLCDNAPATPFSIVKLTLEEELGQRFDLIFDTFDPHPVGSASIAQVHRARLRGATNDVAVKVDRNMRLYFHISIWYLQNRIRNNKPWKNKK